MKIPFPWLTRGLFVLLLPLLLSSCASTRSTDGLAPGQNHGFTASQASAKEWWNTPYPKVFDASSLKPQSFIAVKGNSFVTEDGKSFIFRGVSIADPGKLSMEKRWNKGLFEEVHRWGANTIRLPIHPLSWRKHGSEWFFARIDEAARWANALDMYLIIDWHSMGNLETEMYQHVMYETTQRETADFWRRIAHRYRDVPTVAVYEIFNEPTHDYIGTGAYSLGKSTWESWRNMLETYIDLIYVYNKKAIPLVAGHNWAYDLTQVGHAPVRRQGVAYAIHPYPQKARPADPSRESFFAMWEKDLGFCCG
ncbi:MAG: glycoside hydrolase family 5 protein [Cellvibrionaceae bacterium]|nr:glycoside hydrolase family 5 protein [Cellvibrionaceae bacterium]